GSWSALLHLDRPDPLRSGAADPPAAQRRSVRDLHRPRAGVLMPRGARIAAWTLGGLLLLIVILIGAVVVIGNTAGGRRMLESETAKLTLGRVRIAGLGGSFPGAIDIASLQLSDPKGVWMTAHQVSLRWSPFALLAWHMHIESLHVGDADVVRKPISSPSKRAPSSSSRSSLPQIDIDRMSVDTLVLEPAAAGM